MAQPNVSREPSMEEILASIRRIIESNEPVPARGLEGSYGYDNDADELDIAGTAFSVEAVPMDLPVAANQAGPVTGHAPAESYAEGSRVPVSLADLAARVRATSERTQEAGRRQEQGASGTGRDIPAPSAYASQGLGGFRDMSPLMPEQARIPEQLHTVEQPRIAAPDTLSAGHRHIEALLQPDVAAHVAPEMPTASDRIEMELTHEVHPETGERGLLSMQAGAQVARSFEELAAVVDGQQRRSLDEIAQDMLRPMLQDWLDDNLPTLVERLVREEIERIARGPRR